MDLDLIEFSLLRVVHLNAILHFILKMQQARPHIQKLSPKSANEMLQLRHDGPHSQQV